ncbi:MAG TPA: CBS domain-containing protein [Gaiellaceae bacterium]|nr:CBS domain-containing protein [Gaiellaceae bacterium]
MTTLRETTLATEAFVAEDATFRDAAARLAAVEVSAIAVLDGRRRVAGLFTDDDLLRGLFPGYLADLRHTAFLELDADALAAQLEKAGDDPVARHMREPATVEIDTNTVHAAERFLHTPWGSLAVVDERRFVGMLGQVEFCRAIMRHLAR